MIARRLSLILLMLGSLLAIAPRGSAGALPPGHQYGLVNPLLRMQVRAMEARQGSTRIPVVITTDRTITDQIGSLGGTVEADVNEHIFAAEVPVDAVHELQQVPGVIALYRAQRLRPTLDRSVPEIGANRVWSLRDTAGLPVEGSHVLVGIVDSGIDFRNPDFLNADGSSRIVSLWNQTFSGTPPNGQTFGTECDRAALTSGQCPERDTIGHGTHVAGIAAGNGRSSSVPQFIGVAPRADLAVVASELDTDKIIAGWKYLTDRARALHEPIVINSSFGTGLGPHDGSEPVSRAIDALSGPGTVFVTSAGNDANQGVHTGGTVRQGQTATVTVQTRGAFRNLVFAVFYPPTDEVSATLTTASTGETFGPVPFNRTLASQPSADQTTQVTVDGTPWDDTHHSVLVGIERRSGTGPLSGTWQLTLSGTKITDAGRYDAWLPYGTSGLQAFTPSDESATVSSPADARAGIAVGNYATQTSWIDQSTASHNFCDFAACPGGALQVGQLDPYTSSGPTADGREKPDIAAPGVLITSSRSGDTSSCSLDTGDECIHPTQVSVDGKHLVESGTSMSAPHVTGTVALMLQVDPSLDPTAVASILRSTARHDSFTGPADWSPRFGAGKLDVWSAAQRVLASKQPTPTPVPPTPVAAPSPTHLPLELTMQSVGLGNAKGQAISKPRVGQALYIWMNVRLAHVAANTKLVREWTVKRGGEITGHRMDTVSLGTSDATTYRWSWKYTPLAKGKYTFTLRVTAAQQTSQKTGSFVVQPK